MKQVKKLISITAMLTIAVIIQDQAQTGAYTLNGGTATQTNQTFTSSTTDQSGVYVINSRNLALITCTVSISGNSLNTGNSSSSGLNTAILAKGSSKITITDCSVTTTGTGGVLLPIGAAAVNQQENEQPIGSTLNQNYPHPFNPTINIPFA